MRAGSSPCSRSCWWPPEQWSSTGDLVAGGDDQGWLSPTAGGGIDGRRRCGGLPGALLPATNSPSCCSDPHAIHHCLSQLPPQPAPAQHVYRELMKLLLGNESESDTTSLGCWLWAARGGQTSAPIQ